MAAETGLCPSCSAELGQSGAVAPANAGIEIAERREPAQVAKYIGLALVAALLFGMTTWIVFALAGGGERKAGEPSQSTAASYADEYLSDSEEAVLVIGAANARTLPTTAGTETLRTYTFGDWIEGRWVRGTDRSTRWLRVVDGGERVGYVWGGNLSALRVPRDWLIGAWVEWPESANDAPAAVLCGTDNAIRFHGDGSYRTYDERGTFELSANRLDLTAIGRDTPDLAKSGGIERAHSMTYVVVRVDENVGRLVLGPDNSFRIRRC